jgi:hypothetical protein
MLRDMTAVCKISTMRSYCNQLNRKPSAVNNKNTKKNNSQTCKEPDHACNVVTFVCDKVEVTSFTTLMAVLCSNGNFGI